MIDVNNTEDFRRLLNAMGDTAVYVVKQDTYEILYFNQKMQDKNPQARLGAICHEIWGKHCENCPLQYLTQKDTYNMLSYDNPWTECMDVTASRLLWGEGKVPAFMITTSPHRLSTEEMNREQQMLVEREAIYNSLPGCVMKVLIGDRLQFVEASKSYYEIFGHFGEDHSVGDSIVDEDREWVLKEVNRCGKKAEPLSLEFRIRDKKDRILWMQCEGKHVGWQEGHPLYQFILLDIDDKKRAQIQLLQEQERYRLAVVDVADGIFEYLVKDDYYTCHETCGGRRYNRKMRRFRRKLQQSEVLSLENREKFLRILQGESNGEEMYLAVSEDGTQEWFFCQANHIYENDELKKVVGTFRSIEGLKQERAAAAEQLQAEKKKTRMSEKRFVQGVHQFYDIILEVELYSGEVFIWKQSGALEDALRENKVSLKHLLEESGGFIHPEYRQMFIDNFSPQAVKKAFLAGEKEISLEVPTHMEEEAEYRWQRFQIQTIDQGEDRLRVMICSKDIHESKEREERQKNAIGDALRLAEDANAAKSDFLSRMSHDIRTPMNAIIGMTTLAAAQAEDAEKVREYLGKIDYSSRYLLALLNDVLDMSKIESGKLSISRNSFSMGEVLRRIVSYGMAQKEEKKQTFLVEIGAEAEKEYMGDELRVNQILMNLLSNAFKYTKEGGEIRLGVTCKEIAKGQVLIQISVSDTGVGIKKEAFMRIFNPFEQESKNQQRNGSGLGLAITQNLVHLMGGSIRVDSEVGKGSCFSVDLPLSQTCGGIKTAKQKTQEEEIPFEKLLAQTESFNGELILLVEDNELNIEVAQTLLEMCGLSVEVARNGKEAVEAYLAAEEGRYLAILMDVQMPVMGGYEATGVIRGQSRKDSKTIPIIAMTANAFSTDVEEARRSGMNAHVSKPVDVTRLYRLLQGYREERRKTK